MNKMLKALLVNCSKLTITVGVDIIPDELMECDIILWDYNGIIGFVPEEIVNNLKDLIEDLPHANDLKVSPPKFSFSWDQISITNFKVRHLSDGKQKT